MEKLGDRNAHGREADTHRGWDSGAVHGNSMECRGIDDCPSGSPQVTALKLGRTFKGL